MISYYLSVRQENLPNKLFYVFFSFILIIFSFYVSYYFNGKVSHEQNDIVQLISFTAGMMSAVTYLYGRSGIIGLFIGLLFYYFIIDFSPSGVSIFYTLLVTTLLTASLSLIDTLKHKFHIDKLAFCYYVFFIPGTSSLILAVLAPNDFTITQALNLCLTDAIGVLLTAPITVLFLHTVNVHNDFRSLFQTLSKLSKSNILCKTFIVTCIFTVLYYANELQYSYAAYMVLLPFVMIAALNFSELTQLILIVIGYSLFINNGISITVNLSELNTMLSLFFMFSLIIYIMLDYKMSQKRQAEKYTKHLYFDKQSHLGTFQKLNHDTNSRNDFIVAAIDLTPVFMFPINKRDSILQHIASHINKNTTFYDHSYILYDVSSLIIIIDNNMRAISRLKSLPRNINMDLLHKNANFNVGSIFYCGCKKGSNIKQSVNLLHMNLRMIDKHHTQSLINCDNSTFDNYLIFLEMLDDNNIQLFRQDYKAINRNNLRCFELLSKFFINGNALDTTLVLKYAQKLGRLEMLERYILVKALTYVHSLPKDSFHYAAINLSPDFISSTIAINELFAIAENLSLPLNKICIEIVETGVIENPVALNNNLLMLREKGIHIALDDFGEGHSTYDQLLNMPIDTLKIGGSIISNCHNDIVKLSTIKHLREITTHLNIEIVAECIEKPEELQLLTDLGIDFLQGYLIHHPAPLNSNQTHLHDAQIN